MTATYEVFLYDQSGDPQALLQGWSYLEFTQRLSKPWNSILRIDMSYLDDRVGLFRDDMESDWFIEVYRRHPVTGRNLVYEGLHRTLIDQVLASGVVEFTQYTQGYTALLDRRICLPPTGSEALTFTGAAETAMKDFVDSECISPTDATRIILGLVNEADAGAGSTAEYNARYTILSTVIRRLAEQGAVEFGIVKPAGGAVGDFEFQVRTPWGTDRTTASADPTIFDLFFGNMLIPIYSKNASEEVNYVYIGGQGEGIDRVIDTVSDATAIARSPLNRIERFVDARNEPNADGLATIGQAYLNDYAYKPRLTFNLNETEGTLWLRDWELGDKISARYFTIEVDKQITEVTVQVAATETGIIENIQAELEDA